MTVKGKRNTHSPYLTDFMGVCLCVCVSVSVYASYIQCVYAALPR